jgi:hypothetical protein
MWLSSQPRSRRHGLARQRSATPVARCNRAQHLPPLEPGRTPAPAVSDEWSSLPLRRPPKSQATEIGNSEDQALKNEITPIPACLCGKAK